jgi:gliding motility-associated-like protein
LGSDKNICLGTTAELQPGFVYDKYTWQNGSSASNHVVSNAGLYWVKVADGCGNISSDSIVIDFFKATKDLLAGDTAICSYESLLLKTFTPLQSYKWSNASQTPSIAVNQPGLYWLVGTDLNGCAVSDTILIAAKECQKGFHVPNAFSPNRDGKNDLLRPLVFGELVKYEFRIFNRLGEMIFESRNVFKGWDGKYKGIDQSANAYVWQCIFQFQNEETQYKKGAFILLR